MKIQPDETVHGNVLVIDGDARCGRIISELLSGAGYAMLLVADRDLATAALEQNVYDFIILDPSIYGTNVSQFLWTLAGSGSTMASVIVISAAEDIEAQANQVGARNWFKKPFAPSDVLLEIRRHSRLTAT
jgi:DNA-binding response OmpR family regulator